MKALRTIVVFTTIASLALGSCTTTKVYNSKGLPPGQAKKISGSKSAKPHAPGQKKKVKR